MVIKFREYKIGKLAFKADNTEVLKIPRINAIRWLDMDFFIKHVATASDPIEIQDTILNIIKSMKLTIDGDELRMNEDARKAFFFETIEKGTEPATNKDDNQALSTTKTWFVHLRWDFAVNRLNEHDIRALLPARLYSKLELSVDWGAVGDMFSADPGTITVADSGCKVEVREAFDTENKVAFAKGQAGEGFIEFRETIASLDVDVVHTNLTDDTLEHTIKPNPRLITKQLFLTKDSGGVRVDDVIEKIRLEDTRGSGDIISTRDWDMLNRYLKTEYQLESLPAGIGFNDYVDQNGVGLLTDNDGSIKFKIQNIAPTGTEKFEVLTRYINGRTLVKAANA